MTIVRARTPTGATPGAMTPAHPTTRLSPDASLDDLREQFAEAEVAAQAAFEAVERQREHYDELGSDRAEEAFVEALAAADRAELRLERARRLLRAAREREEQARRDERARREAEDEGRYYAELRRRYAAEDARLRAQHDEIMELIR